MLYSVFFLLHNSDGVVGESDDLSREIREDVHREKTWRIFMGTFGSVEWLSG